MAPAAVQRCPRDLFGGAPIGTVTFADTSATWTDGGDVPVLLGSQGLYMITPRLEIDGALADGEAPELIVRLENRDPGGSDFDEGFPSLETCMRFHRSIDGDLVTEPIYDPLRVAPVPAGTPLVLTAFVGDETFVVTSAITVTLVPGS
jgi:hypothetical protein